MWARSDDPRSFTVLERGTSPITVAIAEQRYTMGRLQGRLACTAEVVVDEQGRATREQWRYTSELGTNVMSIERHWDGDDFEESLRIDDGDPERSYRRTLSDHQTEHVRHGVRYRVTDVIDEDGNTILVAQYDDKQCGPVEARAIYGPDGRLIEDRVAISDEPEAVRTFKYDDQNRLANVEEIPGRLIRDGRTSAGRVEYVYGADAAGNLLVSATAYADRHTSDGRQHSRYDALGRIVGFTSEQGMTDVGITHTRAEFSYAGEQS